MKLRVIAAGLAGVFAVSATVAVGSVVYADRDLRTLPYLVLLMVLVSTAWLGVLGWLTQRVWIAALGTWVAAAGNLWLWSAVVVPIAFALFTTVYAARASLRRAGRSGP